MKMQSCGQAKITKIHPRDNIPKPYKIELLFMNSEPKKQFEICLFSSQSSNSPYNRGGGESLNVLMVEV